MEVPSGNRELTALQEKRDQILSDFEILQDSVHKSIDAGTLSRETFAGAFLLLEEQFDKFTVLVKNLEAPEEIPELPSVQQQVMDCYRAFLSLKKEYEAALEKEISAPEDFSEEDLLEDDEEIQQSILPACEKKPQEKPTGRTLPSQPSGRHKKTNRSVSPPGKKNPHGKKQDSSEKLESDDSEAPADSEKSPAPVKFPGRYRQLKKITRDLGGGACAVIENGAYRAASRTDNEVIRGALNTQYYLSVGAAAMGMAGGVITPPGKKLRTSAAKKLSESQMRKYNADAIRSHRQVLQRIHSMEQTLSARSGFRLSPTERKQMEEELEGLKASLSQSEKAAAFGQKVQDFQHRRDLDNEVLAAFTVNRKLPRNPRSLHELGSQYLKKQSAELTKQYGEGFWETSRKSLQRDIKASMKEAGSLKSQIDLLQGQGKALSADQRLHLLRLKKQMQTLGTNITGLKTQQSSLQNYAYVSSQVNSVLTQADKYAHNTALSLNFLRNTITRPLFDSENNTTFLAYEMKVLSDPRVVQDLYKASRAVLHAPYQILKKTSPKLATRIRYRQEQEKKEQLQKEKARQEQIARKKSQSRTPMSPEKKSASEPISPEQKHKKAVRRKLREHISEKSSRNRYTVKSAEKALKTSAPVKKATAKAAQTAAPVLKKAGGKYLLIAAAVIFLIMLLFEVISAIGDAGMSVIFSPNEGENGKIDLGPYVTVIEQEKRKFTAMRDDLEQDFYDEIEQLEAGFNQKYQNPPKYQIVGGEDYKDQYSKINVTFDGPSSNDRELIAMMAVRFQQDLEDPDALRYLQHMAAGSRKLLTASDKSYNHRPGCVSVKVQKKQEPGETRPEEGGSHVVPGVRSLPQSGRSHVAVPTEPDQPQEDEYEVKRFCPGHRELNIHIHVLELEELFAADDWEEGPEEWDGWTEDNREWVKLFLEMDWAELYSGFRPGGFISVNGALPPEEERHIWDSLHSMTGNPYAAAGIMGNLHCESRLLSNNLEDHYQGILGYSDESYTAAVDNGSYTDFINDSAGYGLAQWTYHTRKKGLLDLAGSRGTSVSDVDMQLSYLESEFRSFGMMGSLQNMTSVEEASDYILFHFERPENPNSLQPTRAGISSYFYNKYMLGSAAEGDLTQAQMDVIRIATNSEAYGIPARGGYCQAWAANVYGKAGFPIDNSSCARVSGERYGVSSDFTIVPPGAAVYGYSSSKYGHVGIYVGGGLVYHNIGGVAVDNLADWVQRYNGFCWGWQAGTDLTAQP